MLVVTMVPTLAFFRAPVSTCRSQSQHCRADRAARGSFGGRREAMRMVPKVKPIRRDRQHAQRDLLQDLHRTVDSLLYRQGRPSAGLMKLRHAIADVGTRQQQSRPNAAE